ncbi:hypothetical protein PHMEG_00010586 [Phytophthora megakarya]|uniref:Uncharacterized protein n=1 Tax=Phytophthora megakarya TaxID=4795 RepID=A0A225WDB7_9STRA|nr:hypothetical protein PHMEG_00010586 [Phytophthora megakarya]
MTQKTEEEAAEVEEVVVVVGEVVAVAAVEEQVEGQVEEGVEDIGLMNTNHITTREKKCNRFTNWFRRLFDKSIPKCPKKRKEKKSKKKKKNKKKDDDNTRRLRTN